jgi:hypothetical protein
MHVSLRAAGLHARWAGPLVVVTVALLPAACRKETESLILVQLSAERPATYPITSVTLESSGRTRTYDVDGLSIDKMNPTTLGLYVDQTGKVDVTATARPAKGHCEGFSGGSSTSIRSDGETRYVPIPLKPADVCDSQGTGGQGGGMGGSGGSGPVCHGTQQPVGTPPTLACCTTYDHAELAAGTPCDDNDTYVYTAAFSPDGSLVMTGGDDGRVLFWTYDPVQGVLRPEGHFVTKSHYGYAAFSPDGTLVAVGGDQAIDVYYLTGTKAWTLAAALDVSGVVYGVGFTPDSKRVISVDSTPTLYVHALTQAAPLYQVSVPVEEPYGLAVSPSVVLGAVGVAIPDGLGLTAVYRVSDTAILGPDRIDTGSQSIWGACFSPDGNTLVLNEIDALARFYNFPTLDPAGASIDIGNDDDVRGCAFSPSGGYIALAGGWTQGSASIWSAAARTMTSRYNFLDSEVLGLSVGFAPAGNAIVVGGMGCGKFLLCNE